jgi:RNA polymerase sigma-70 factor, ECF subfamily
MDRAQTASDADLVAAVVRRDQSALAEIYRRHGAAAHSLAWRVIVSHELADEVTQEVFLDLWSRPHLFDAERGSLRTYLLTRTHGRAVDVVRAEAARQRREDRHVGEDLATRYDADLFTGDLVTADKVRRAMEILTAHEREAIELAYFGALTYREVAATLGAPEGTVKSRIRVGLRRLRDALVAEGVVAP